MIVSILINVKLCVLHMLLGATWHSSIWLRTDFEYFYIANWCNSTPLLLAIEKVDILISGYYSGITQHF